MPRSSVQFSESERYLMSSQESKFTPYANMAEQMKVPTPSSYAMQMSDPGSHG